jgi:hypothetical protein
VNVEGTSGTRPAAAVRASVRAAVAREPGLCLVGVYGIVWSGVCLVGVAVQGRSVPPEGKLLDAATFCFGVGVFTLTLALLLPLAGYSATARRRWRWGVYAFTVYGLTLESVQAFRGLDPRFSEEGGLFEEISGPVFGLTALLLTVLFVLLGLRFFRSDVLADRPTLRLGIRYGAIAVALSFGVGIAMSINSGRDIGEHGNLLLPHALGVHGIQALPLVALLVAAGTVPTGRTLVHATGIAWLVACAAALAQAGLGQAPFEASVLTAAVIVGIGLWAAGAGHAVVTRVRAAT